MNVIYNGNIYATEENNIYYFKIRTYKYNY